MTKNALSVIQNTLKSEETINEVITTAGLHNDNIGKGEANKYILSMLNEIERSIGSYLDVTKCEVNSVKQVLVDAVRFRVPIDGRKMAHIDVRYDKNRGVKVAVLQIDANGFVIKITEHFPDFRVVATPAYDGDDVVINDDDSVSHKQKNPFCDDVEKLMGVVVKYSYTDKSGRFMQGSQVVTKKDLLTMKAMSKSGAWTTWAIERMKTAAIKRVCKWLFKSIQGLQEIIEYDNRLNYDLSKNDTSLKSETVIDNINQVLDDNNDDDIIEVEEIIDIAQLETDGEDASHKGKKALKEWAGSLTDKERSSVRHKGEVWNENATAADNIQDDEDFSVI